MADADDPISEPADGARLRALPAVSAVLRRAEIAALVEEHGHAAVVAAVRGAIADARAAIAGGGEPAVRDDDVRARVERTAGGTLRPVLNATGVLVHTNLGRAPLAEEALDAIARASRGYATLEYDLEQGRRGERSVHAVGLVRELTGAEDALVVNNNAAAVLLALTALAAGREVIVSRGELVEIGGGFRVPDVLRQSGARLVEVGATNRTHLDDYARAMTPETALVLKVHRSNFAMVGFTSEVELAELARFADARGVPLVYDAGSGALAETEAREPAVSTMIRAGAHLVTFSGDKLLGGPQAGIVAGKRALVERMRRHPLTRALRADKTCLAALQATLALWRDDPERIPVVRMQRARVEELDARAQALAAALRARAPFAVVVVDSVGRVGGGAAPTRELPGRAVRLAPLDADALCARLRAARPPVVARIEDGAVLLDLRTVAPEDDARLTAAALGALASS